MKNKARQYVEHLDNCVNVQECKRAEQTLYSTVCKQSSKYKIKQERRTQSSTVNVRTQKRNTVEHSQFTKCKLRTEEQNIVH